MVSIFFTSEKRRHYMYVSHFHFPSSFEERTITTLLGPQNSLLHSISYAYVHGYKQPPLTEETSPYRKWRTSEKTITGHSKKKKINRLWGAEPQGLHLYPNFYIGSSGNIVDEKAEWLWEPEYQGVFHKTVSSKNGSMSKIRRQAVSVDVQWEGWILQVLSPGQRTAGKSWVLG